MKTCFVILFVLVCFTGVSAVEPVSDAGILPSADPAVQEVVRRAYQDILGRQPDPEGLAHYTQVLTEGAQDERWLRNHLRHSPEGERLRADRRDTVFALFLLFIFWMVLFILLAATGYAVVRSIFWLTRRAYATPNVFQLFWLGLGAVIVVLQLGSLFFPIGDFFLFLFMVVGCCAFGFGVYSFYRGRSQRTVKPATPSYLLGTGWLGILFVVLGGIIVWQALLGTTTWKLTAYDTSLYHWSAVRWMNTYPAVPGLANLHVRLGTNSAWLLFAALLDNSIFDRRTAWLLPGFPLVVVALQLLYTCCVEKNNGLRTRLFALCLLPYLMRHVVQVEPGLYFDVPALLAQAVFFLEALRWFDHRHRGFQEGRSGNPVAMLIVTVPAAISFVIKPVGALSLIVVGVIIVIAIIRSFTFSRLWVFQSMVIGGLPGLLLVGWMARNAILSGWLFFPAPYGAFPVDWAVPLTSAGESHAEQMQSVRGQQDIIRAWSRRPGSRYREALRAPARDWMPKWYDLNQHAIEIRYLLPVSLALSIFLVLYGAFWNKPGGSLDIPLVILSAGLVVFWFGMAPDLRFGDGLFWNWFALTASAVLVVFWRMAGRAWGSVACALVVASLSYPVGGTLIGGLGVSKPRRIGESRAWPTREVILENGQMPRSTVWVPVRGDRSGDAPLPNTPYPDHRLLMRRPGNLRYGFRRVDETEVIKGGSRGWR